MNICNAQRSQEFSETSGDAPQPNAPDESSGSISSDEVSVTKVTGGEVLVPEHVTVMKALHCGY